MSVADRRLSGRHRDPAVHDPGDFRGGPRCAAGAHRGHPLARAGDRRRSFPGRPVGDDQGAGALLGEDYDWRGCEARLNALPQFVTEIDGLDIHFIHVRSPHDNALPLIITHGWPGSIVEMLKVIGPLTDPTAHGGERGDAFHVVVPSMPGYGFSGKPPRPGWDPDRIARAWDQLMQRLGYTQFVAQGGDWGAIITDLMARAGAAGLLGIHTNMPRDGPARHRGGSSRPAAPAPDGLSTAEKGAFDQLALLLHQGHRLRAEMGDRAADAVRAGRLARRPGRLDDRSRRVAASATSRRPSAASRSAT